jgi:hypothetical protein
MIRTYKPIQLLEWGKGTNTLNQVWTVIGEGKITDDKMRDGLTTLEITLDKPISRESDSLGTELKLTQQGEGMAGGSNRWGEVAVAYLTAVQDGGRRVIVEIRTAAKVDRNKRNAETSVPVSQER